MGSKAVRRWPKKLPLLSSWPFRPAKPPAPPVGPALGQHGVNIMMFCKEYNARTQDKAGYVIPVEISVFEDRSFTFITKTPPASVLITKAAKIDKGSGESAKGKLPDLNCTSVESAMRIIE